MYKYYYFLNGYLCITYGLVGLGMMAEDNVKIKGASQAETMLGQI